MYYNRFVWYRFHALYGSGRIARATHFYFLSIIKKPTEKANDLQPRARLAVWTTKEEFFDVLTTKQQDV